MEDIRCDRFRISMQIFEHYIQKYGIKLLHCNYGYIVFTTEKMHARFNNAGNGQWQDIKDLFFFTFSFNAEERGNVIELWCYADSPIRKAWDDKVAHQAQVFSRYSKKGFDLFYDFEIIPERERPGTQVENTKKLINDLNWFLSSKIFEIEKVLLS